MSAKFSYFLAGIALGALAGLLFAPHSGEETRKYLSGHSKKALDTLNQQAGKLRKSAEGMVKKGKRFMGLQGRDSAETTTDAENQAYQEERRENMGG